MRGAPRAVSSNDAEIGRENAGQCSRHVLKHTENATAASSVMATQRTQYQWDSCMPLQEPRLYRREAGKASKATPLCAAGDAATQGRSAHTAVVKKIVMSHYCCFTSTRASAHLRSVILHEMLTAPRQYCRQAVCARPRDEQFLPCWR